MLNEVAFTRDLATGIRKEFPHHIEYFDGGHQWPPHNLKHLFVSTSTPDLHLRDSGQYAGNAGLDLSAGFSRDIDDAVRTDTWDMVADEGVPGTLLLNPKVLTWREIEPQ